MRQAVSISLKEETVLALREKIRSSNRFRNKSHLVETAIDEFLKNEYPKEASK